MLTLTTILVLLYVMFRSSLSFQRNGMIFRRMPKSFCTRSVGSIIGFDKPIQWCTRQSSYYHPPWKNAELISFWRRSSESTTRLASHAAAIHDSTSRDKDDETSILLKGLNPAQKQAVTQPLNSITRVIAGPGAGKTRVLTSRVAYLLEHDASSRILAVTFTRKAAGEMKERLEKIVHEQEQARRQARLSLLQDDDEDDSIPRDYEEYGEYGIMEENQGGSMNQRGLNRVTVGTFHSVCGTILRWNGEYLDFLPSVVEDMMGSVNETYLNGQFTIIDAKDQAKLISECLKELEIDVAKQKDVSPRNILSEISRLKAEKFEGHESDTQGSDDRDKKKKMASRTAKIAREVYPLYRQHLLSKNMLDFDDLIYMTRELLFVQPQVRENLQRRWTHVLVDEFQDTSKVQLELVKLLTSSSLLIVGDADQSIYSWRGAHVKSMSDFEDEFESVRTVYLMENYRSTSNIVKAAQKIISDSMSDSASANAKMRQNMKPMRGEGPPPRVIAFPNGEKQAEFVVKEIKDLIAKNTLGSNPTVAIIYRTNAQSRELEEACVKLNLPYIISGKATSFYQREEVKDCLCFLRWLCNGMDETAMIRAFKTPSKGLGEKAVEEFAAYYKQVAAFHASKGNPKLSPLDVLICLTDFQRNPKEALLDADAPTPIATISKRALKNLEKFSTQMNHLRGVAHSDSLEKLLGAIIEIFDFRAHMQSISNNSKDEFEERWSNVQELQVATKRYSDDIPCLRQREQAKPTGSVVDESPIPIANFLDDVALVADLEVEDDTDGGEKRVVANLMTIHASKGKEFEAVFLVGNEDGTFPTMQAVEGNAEIDEERRLCYVAVTRAKTYLYMTWRQEVNIYTDQGIRSRTAYRSRFLDKLVSNGQQTSSQGPSNGRDLRAKATFPPAPSYGSKRHASTSSSSSSSASPSRQFSKPSYASSNVVPKYGDSTSRQAASPAFATTKVYGSTKSNLFRDVSSLPSPLRNGSSPSIPREYLKPSQPKPVAPKPASAYASTSSYSSSSRPRDFGSTPASSRPATTSYPTSSSFSSRPSPSRPVDPARPIKQSAAATKRSSSTDRHHGSAIDSPQPDSTWFYPVGSSVLHRNHGIGVVLQPPPRSKNESDEGRLLVRVEFETGQVMEFDAVGTDLLPN